MTVEQAIEESTLKVFVRVNWENLNRFPPAISRLERDQLKENFKGLGEHLDQALKAFQLIDKTIAEADKVECLTSNSRYIRETKQWQLEHADDRRST